MPAMNELHFAVPMVGAVLNALNIRLDAPSIAFQLDHSFGKSIAAMSDAPKFRRDIRSERFIMEFAASAPEALERAKTIADPLLILILSDINMPGMSGLEMLPQEEGDGARSRRIADQTNRFRLLAPGNRPAPGASGIVRDWPEGDIPLRRMMRDRQRAWRGSVQGFGLLHGDSKTHA